MRSTPPAAGAAAAESEFSVWGQGSLVRDPWRVTAGHDGGSRRTLTLSDTTCSRPYRPVADARLRRSRIACIHAHPGVIIESQSQFLSLLHGVWLSQHLECAGLDPSKNYFY
eukprot:COSAG01_NODE_729_length_14031_cov_24.502800_8_plen_112_part_00